MAEQVRKKITLSEGFRFLKTDSEDPRYAAFDLCDRDFKAVRVPHDWAIEGPFARENDLSHMEVWADGIKTPIAHTGRTGGLPIVGTGWYRLPLFLPEEYRGKRLRLVFDGVMSESKVYLNGIQLAENHYGYFSFAVDITDFAEYGKENLLALSATVAPDSSRWYPGAGLFRKAHLLVTERDAIAYSGIRTHITNVSEASADLSLSLITEGAPDAFRAILTAPDGKEIPLGEAAISENKGSLSAHLLSPALFRLFDPNLYTLTVEVLKNGEVTDREAIKIGFRSFRFDPNEGFFLNGEAIKLHGVCLHHDLGALGAAFNLSALRRQLLKMIDMGANAIRLSHNPPDPALLDLTDELGLFVIDEFFDEWRIAKVKGGYSRFFDTDAEEDVCRIIHRDMNHPSIFLWSIGNEILEQRVEGGDRVAHFLADICRREDPTRPVTAGFNDSAAAEKNGLFEALDVIGLNYKPFWYRMYHEKYPEKVFMGSETVSCISLRGDFPMKAEHDSPAAVREDLSMPDYSLSAPGWGCSPEHELHAQADLPFICGEFVWTGFDYLGEPTPYYTEWPSRSSYFGILDTAGMEKSRAYLYKSAWTNTPTLHIFPHQNFEGHEGENIPVHIYTNCRKVALFQNGRLLGEKFTAEPPAFDVKTTFAASSPEDRERDNARHHLIFDPVLYETGTLLAIGYDDEGNEIARDTVKTAGEPYRIALTPERTELPSNGEDTCFVKAEILDRDGNLCPKANSAITFSAAGAGALAATDNGDPRDTTPFPSPTRSALNGIAVAILMSGKEEGVITLTAEAEGLISDQIKITVTL